MYDPYANFETATLANGLKVYALHAPGRVMQEVSLIVHAGSLHENADFPGLAHFVEHVVASDNGIEIGPSQLEQRLSPLGAYLNANTSPHRTMYKIRFVIGSPIVRELFTSLGKMCLRSSVDTYIERERKAILREFGSSVDERKNAIAFNINAALFHNRWLARKGTPIGTKKSVLSIGQEQLSDFYTAFYVPKNMTVVSVGGMRIDELVSCLIDGGLGEMREGPRTTPFVPLSPIPPPVTPSIREELSQIDGVAEKSTTHSIHWAARAEKTFFMSSVVRVLMKQKLMEELRDNHSLVYEIDAYWENHGACSEFCIAALDLEPGQVEKAHQVMLDAVDSIADRRSQFEGQKQAARYGVLGRDETLASIRENAVIDIIRHGRIVPASEDLAEIESTTFEDVLKVYSQFTKERALAVTIVE